MALHGKYCFMAIIFWLSNLDACRSIMVEFGTSKGPILPKLPANSSLQPKTIVARSPAPVREIQEDIPNPNKYQPLIPHQYRTKLYSLKPNPNLILGTPLDQKYSPSLHKYSLYKKQYLRNLGRDYTGPHTFGKHDYELYQIKKTTLQPSVKYSEQETQNRLKANQQQNYVPQIGIIYSGGVRYYVPQTVYFTPNEETGREENSVYDNNEEKIYIYNNRQ